MVRLICLLILFSMVGLLYAQEKPLLKKKELLEKRLNNPNDSLGRKPRDRKSNTKENKAKIEQYLIISREFDTTYVDTTLSILKEYKFNYLRKDDFDVLPFQNIGQTYNSLSYNFSSLELNPSFGARAKHFNFKEIDDVNYYRVPTPLTELMFKTAFEQGQLLESFFTVNTSERFNFSIAYKGLRSLGKYQHTLTSTGNFSFTTNYQTKNKRYNMRGHIVMQDTYNDENGGISDEDLEDFESGNPEFIDRSVFDPLFEDAENELRGKRFHLDHSYTLLKQIDSIKKPLLTLGNIVSFKDKYYQFKQTSQNDLFGESFNSRINDKVKLEDFYIEGNAKLKHKNLGLLKAFLGYNDYNYGYDKLVIIEGNTITNRIIGNTIIAGGEYKNQIGKFLIHGKFGINVSGDRDANYLNGSASYIINDDYNFQLGININSKTPNYNYLLYQSDYINYNWQNNFDNVQSKQFNALFNSNKYGNLSLDYTTINNYTYFSKNDQDLVKPFQTDKTINYVRLKFNNEIKFGKFALNNTIRYQKVLDGEGVLNVPEISTRNTIYYANHFFEKKALYLQTGITFNYFSSYSMDAYDPLLAEFYTQNQKEIGSFPRLDFFINAKVRQTRIFLKAEHFNSSFTGYSFYSAPNYPYRDFVVRFGIVWNFFL